MLRWNLMHYIAGLVAVVAALILSTFITTAHSAQRGVLNTVPVVDSFGLLCNESDENGLMTMYQGVIKSCVTLMDGGVGFYPEKYDKYGFPIKVTLYLQLGNGGTFSGKIRTHGWLRLYPKSTKPKRADKHWHWAKIKATVDGVPQVVRQPRWFFRHLMPNTFAGWYFTIKLPGNPAVACVKAVAKAKGVKGAPTQIAWGTFYDKSTGSPPPTSLCG